MTEPASQGRIKVGSILEGKYRLIREVALGGVGAVYEAEHLLFKKRVAIKVLLSQFATDVFLKECFIAEGRAAAAIAHPNVADIYDFGKCANGSAYLVMELLLGPTLCEIIQERAPLPVSDACELILQALAGLAAAHRQGIVHRDIKPANIVVCQTRAGSTLVKVVDFGIAQGVMDSSYADAPDARVWGTPLYSAPEQILGNPVDARTDLFSLGVIIYELLAGTPPHTGDNPTQIFSNTLKGRRTQLHEVNPSVPVGLSQLLERVFSIDPDERCATAVAFARELAPFVSGAKRTTLLSLNSPSFPLLGSLPNSMLANPASTALSPIQINSVLPVRILQRVFTAGSVMTESLLTFPKIPRAPAAPRINVSEISSSEAPLSADAHSSSLVAPAVPEPAPPSPQETNAAWARRPSSQMAPALIAAGTGFGAGLLLAHWAGLL